MLRKIKRNECGGVLENAPHAPVHPRGSYKFVLRAAAETIFLPLAGVYPELVEGRPAAGRFSQTLLHLVRQGFALGSLCDKLTGSSPYGSCTGSYIYRNQIYFIYFFNNVLLPGVGAPRAKAISLAF